MNCTNTIVGGTHRTTVNIQTADIELPGSYGISDPNNVLYGEVHVNDPYSPYGKTNNGGQNLRIIALDGKDFNPASISPNTGVSAAYFSPRSVIPATRQRM